MPFTLVAHPSGATLLHLAARAGAVGLVHFLAAEGHLVSPPDREGRTPLDYARDAGHDLAYVALLADGGRPGRREEAVA